MTRQRAATLTIALCLLACGQQAPKPPLYLGLAFDVSGSAKHLPALTSEEVARLCRLVEKTGGKLAFAPIDEGASEPLDRLSLMPIHGQPLNEQAARAKKNRTESSRWQQRVLAAIEKQDAKTTDLWGTIRRFSLFFGESQGVRKVLLVVSDCRHDGPSHRPVSLSGDIRVLVVGAEPEQARGVFAEAQLAESVLGVLEILEGEK